MNSHWNRSGRTSGGYRKFSLPRVSMTKDDAQIIIQEQMIRQEFGEEGVRRFYEALEEKAKLETYPDNAQMEKE